jgi:hypothetical protein
MTAFKDLASEAGALQMTHFHPEPTLGADTKRQILSTRISGATISILPLN